jgi:hypothetical protein
MSTYTSTTASSLKRTGGLVAEGLLAGGDPPPPRGRIGRRRSKPGWTVVGGSDVGAIEGSLGYGISSRIRAGDEFCVGAVQGSKGCMLGRA